MQRGAGMTPPLTENRTDLTCDSLSSAELVSQTESLVEAVIENGQRGRPVDELPVAESSRAANKAHLECLYELTARVQCDNLSAFESMYNELELTDTTAYAKFIGITDQLFRDGTNWGRIVAFLSFISFVSRRCEEQGRERLVPSLKRWSKRLLVTKLLPWIHRQGGWEDFYNHFQASRSKTRARWTTLAGAALLVGMAAIYICH